MSEWIILFILNDSRLGVISLSAFRLALRWLSACLTMLLYDLICSESAVYSQDYSWAFSLPSACIFQIMCINLYKILDYASDYHLELQG